MYRYEIDHTLSVHGYVEINDEGYVNEVHVELDGPDHEKMIHEARQAQTCDRIQAREAARIASAERVTPGFEED